jgi:hypothetical protein
LRWSVMLVIYSIVNLLSRDWFCAWSLGNIAFEDMLCITCIPEYYGILHAHHILLVDDNFTWLIILTDPSSSCRGWCF